MGRSLLPVTSDFVFKLIFGDQRNVDILEDFLKSVLDIPKHEYERITIVDPHLKKESQDDKYGIVDVKVHTKDGSIIHVEMQAEEIPEFEQRSLYFISKMITEQLSSGKSHANIKRVISIIITNYALIPESGSYHNQFRFRSGNIEFTDLMEINTLELSKLPPITDTSDLWYWMQFMKVKDEEELGMLEEYKPAMSKAVAVLKELSEEERTRMIQESQEIARRDEYSRMNVIYMGGKIEILRNLQSSNIPVEMYPELMAVSSEEMDKLIAYSNDEKRMEKLFRMYRRFLDDEAFETRRGLKN